MYVSPVIYIGNLPLGGNHPIRLQSMTNTDTMDTAASVSQCIRIIEAGADLVRLTAQSVREAENLANIKKELRLSCFGTPLVADIHFNPQAAETAARIVEKVRINPGNYTDKRASFRHIDLSSKEYDEELERIHSRLLPLINICRENKTVIRIGINHGSLSDRIMSRYGNTPDGMVRSALEFIDIFRSENFNNLVLSMKSSDTSIMIKATRMLVEELQEKQLAYPVHLGVTEAGEGEDGRIRSAAGIGALLADGIGDTIRVSLSENPENEIPVAAKLVKYMPRGIAENKPSEPLEYTTPPARPEIFNGINGPLVIADLRNYPEITSKDLADAGYDTGPSGITKTDGSADLVLTDILPAAFTNVNFGVPHDIWLRHSGLPNVFPVFTPQSFVANPEKSDRLNILLTNTTFNFGEVTFPLLVIYSFEAGQMTYSPYTFLNSLMNHPEVNVVLQPEFTVDDVEDLRIKAAALLGSYIDDRRIAGISLKNSGKTPGGELTRACFSILQCTETRITRTLYVSCPTCGRTKFDLQEAVRKVKAATSHLKGIRIAVMGCIVNGPGEMAGADYGYVGAAPGKVHIYKGMDPVKKNVPEEIAVEELLKVIQGDL